MESTGRLLEVWGRDAAIGLVSVSPARGGNDDQSSWRMSSVLDQHPSIRHRISNIDERGLDTEFYFFLLLQAKSKTTFQPTSLYSAFSRCRCLAGLKTEISGMHTKKGKWDKGCGWHLSQKPKQKSRYTMTFRIVQHFPTWKTMARMIPMSIDAF